MIKLWLAPCCSLRVSTSPSWQWTGSTLWTNGLTTCSSLEQVQNITPVMFFQLQHTQAHNEMRQSEAPYVSEEGDVCIRHTDKFGRKYPNNYWLLISKQSNNENRSAQVSHSFWQEVLVFRLPLPLYEASLLFLLPLYCGVLLTLQ